MTLIIDTIKTNMEIIAHRGIHNDRILENSDLAIMQALNYGCQAIEVDLQLTGDGEIIVFHDFHLQRIFGINKALIDYNYLQLQQLTPLNSAKGQILSLSQLLALVPDDILINLELKSISLFDRGRLVEKVLQQLKDHQRKKILLSSFNPWLLYKCRATIPEIKRAWLINRKVWFLGYLISLSRAKPHFIHCSLKLLKSSYYQKISVLGLPIRVFTVNTPEDYSICQQLHVAGVFSDNPSVLVK